MSDNVVAKRYAKALFEAARDSGSLANVQEELKVIVDLLEQDASFRSFLNHPNISAADKAGLVQKSFGNQLSEMLFNALQLIFERRRETILTAMYRIFVQISNEALGQATAIVYTPSQLQDKESKEIGKLFGKLTGKRISVENIIDAALIGGMRVRIGDRLYDGSVASKLDQLKNQLKQNA